jgi:glucans biosynthesis protein
LRDLIEPPPHVSKRCGAHARTTGKPCRRWATIGRSRCRLHGGAKGSGRPATSGKHTAHALRMRRFMYVVRLLLARHYDMPEPIEALPGGCDSETVIGQSSLEHQLDAKADGRARAPGEAGGGGEPQSLELPERSAPGADAAPATLARHHEVDPAQTGAASDTPAIR